MALVEIRDVDKSFQRDTQRIDVFTGLTLDIDAGSFTALLLTRLSGRERNERVKIALDVVGLADRADHYPRQLSGGQEQRTAIARAIVADPTVMLLDEPTGQLDAKSSQEVLTLLQRLNNEFNKTIIIVTHDAHAAERAKTILHLEKGDLIEKPRVAAAAR